MKIENLFLVTLFFLSIATYTLAFNGGSANLGDPFTPEIVQVQQDTVPLKERYGDFVTDPNANPFDLSDPNIVEKEVKYDPATGQYIITEKIGDDFFRMPSYMTFNEYLDYRAKEQEANYFKQLAGISTGDGTTSSNADPLKKIDVKNRVIDRLFGGSTVDIRPQGNIDLTFGGDYQRRDDPSLSIRQQRNGGFDFDMQIEMQVDGKIGEKLNLSTSYNTQATFDFENQMKLEYNSDAFSGEDDIIKDIQAGNVSFPLRTNLIQGSQSLFGVKTDLRFGKLLLSMVASQQKSQQESIQIENGAQIQEFEVRADEYDENRHFFLSHYNRDIFESSMVNLPQIKSLVKITNIEVWITNDRNETQNVRDIIAISDIGEPTRFTNLNPIYNTPISPPRNTDVFGTNGLPGRRAGTNVDANNIYGDLIENEEVRQLDNALAVLTSEFGLEQTRDFEKISARLLNQNEYSYNSDLGFISLNVNLQPDQVLAVAFEYDHNGTTYKVGELAGDFQDSEDSLQVLFVKMLKSTTPRVDLPTWDLMMKNHYSTGAFQANSEDFFLDIFYDDPGLASKRFIPELADQPLLSLFNLDQLNVQGDPCSDGIFDFVPTVTINQRNGRIMFPLLEPFGSSLNEIFIAQEAANPGSLNLDDLNEKYVYQDLYDETITRARENLEQNRFTIRGKYKSSVSSEISLGAFNLPEGSVTVRAGGVELREGSDYEVDYNIGRITILNDAYLTSGTPVNVSFEDNTLFGFQTKTMLGVRADYEVNKNFNVGATYLHLFERPFTQKVNIGDDPINNRIYGLDINFTQDAPWLTKAVDAIPFIQTKEPSSITVNAEAAILKPGHSRAIDQGNGDEGSSGGTVFVDDFEGSTSRFDLRVRPNLWTLASVPQNDTTSTGDPLFRESELINDTRYGTNRAKLNWYRVDQTVNDNQGSPYTVRILEREVFPNQNQETSFTNGNLGTFDLTYYPEERGPYNFDLPNGTEFSEGLNNQGGLTAPESRWAGIMQALNTNDFEATNIEFLEFWMLNPFMDNPGGITTTQGGDLYFNLGNVSEDVLRDSRKFFENGIPVTPDIRTDETNWGVIPRTNSVVNAFDNDPDNREIQDVGFDGLNNNGEESKFAEYLSEINNSSLIQSAKDDIRLDPSNDDFRNFLDFDNDTPILERYSQFNNPQGNTPINNGNRPTSSTNLPDSEDLNRDNTLSETESYFRYKIPIRPTATPGESGNREIAPNPYIAETRMGIDGRVWYRFKVPLDSGVPIGGIQNFRSIRFIRMFLKGFPEQVTMRFARLELVRNQWRRYRREVGGVDCPPDAGIEQGDVVDLSTFNINAVNFEDNNSKEPFNYVIPLGIRREQSLNSSFPNALQNEQSLSMEVDDVGRCEARGTYKIVNMDMRLYERMEMFVHAEARGEGVPLDNVPDDSLSFFVRLGSDFIENYYEYSIPLKFSLDNSLSPTSEEYQLEVWKELNNMVIPLSELKDLKLRRNAIDIDIIERYTETFVATRDGQEIDDEITVQGNPNLGEVKGVMLGVRNNSDESHSAEIWVNELRLSGIDERGGIAATATVDMTLADFGDVNMAVNYTSLGWGGLEENVSERARESEFGYDIATNLELGKFLPEKSGIRIPFYAQYTYTEIKPEYDPFDKDVTLDEKLDIAETKAEKDSIRSQALDIVERRSISFNNVRKERTDKTSAPKPWDIENFSATYVYNNTSKTNPLVESDETVNHQASLTYDYGTKTKFITPFKKLSKSKWLELITDINIGLLPKTFAFASDWDRKRQETIYRFTENDDPFTRSFSNKQFTWDRSYDLQWDFTKNLKFNFNAVNEAVIDELKAFDELGRPTTEEERKKVIRDGLKSWGRNKFYRHNLSLDWTLPLKKIPFLNWMQVKAQYGADYSWAAAAQNTIELGNVIQNKQNRRLNGDLNFEKLYKKSKYLNNIEKKKKKKGKGRKKIDKGGKDAKSKLDKGGKDKDEKEDKKKKKKKKDKEPSTIERVLIRPLLLLRKAKVSYSEKFGTTIPGFLPDSEFFGLGRNFSAPGWEFVTGLQPNIDPFGTTPGGDFLQQSARKGWMSTDIFLNQQVFQDYQEAIDVNVTLEPLKDFRIDLTATRTFSENTSLYFRDTVFNAPPTPPEDLVHTLPREIGSYEISYFAMNTLFNDPSAIFETFNQNRSIISRRQGTGVHSQDGAGFSEGFGKTQQDVLLPAFIAAYTGQDANTIELQSNYARTVLFNVLPKINWKVNYRGLSKLPWFEDIFSNIDITHGYSSTLRVNSFETDQDFNLATPNVEDNKGNFFSRFEIPNVVISEQFSPLLGVQIKTKSNMDISLDFKKSRNLSLSFINNDLNETKTTEFVVGFGYTLKDVVIGFLKGGSKKKKGGRLTKRDKKNNDPSNLNPNASKGKATKGSDMNIVFDFSLRDDETLLHSFDGTVEPTRGSKTISINPSVDYDINKQLNARLFFDFRRTIPANSAQIAQTNMAGGITIRFSLN